MIVKHTYTMTTYTMGAEGDSEAYIVKVGYDPADGENIVREILKKVGNGYFPVPESMPEWQEVCNAFWANLKE